MKTQSLNQIQIKEMEDFYVNNSLRIPNKFKPIVYIIKQVRENKSD